MTLDFESIRRIKIFQDILTIMVRNVEISDAERKEMEDGGGVSAATRKDRDMMFENLKTLCFSKVEYSK